MRKGYGGGLGGTQAQWIERGKIEFHSEDTLVFGFNVAKFFKRVQGELVRNEAPRLLYFDKA